MKLLPKNTTIPLLLLLTLIFTLTIFEGLNHYARTAPGGVDFLVHWIANRHLLQGESPYSENVTLEIQQWVYGRPARLHEHQQRDVYPLYAVVVFAPFTTIHDFATARAAWTTLLFLSIIGVLGLSLALLHWRPQPWLLGLLTFFALTWYHNVRLLINGNATGVVALLQMLAVWLLSKNRRHSDVAAGLALALSTFKPNLALLPFLWLNGWAWARKRRAVNFAALGGWLALAGSATVWWPGWWWVYARALRDFPGYNRWGTVQAILSAYGAGWGKALGLLLTVGLTAWLAWAWWRHRQADFRSALWVFALTQVAGQWIGIPGGPDHFLLLLFPLLMVLHWLWRHPRRWGRWAAWALLAWCYVVPWVMFLTTVRVESNGQPWQTPLLSFPVPAVLLVGLAAMQWKGARSEPAAPAPL